jgi:hypothetical protein
VGKDPSIPGAQVIKELDLLPALEDCLHEIEKFLFEFAVQVVLGFGLDLVALVFDSLLFPPGCTIWVRVFQTSGTSDPSNR